MVLIITSPTFSCTYQSHASSDSEGLGWAWDPNSSEVQQMLLAHGPHLEYQGSRANCFCPLPWPTGLPDLVHSFHLSSTIQTDTWFSLNLFSVELCRVCRSLLVNETYPEASWPLCSMAGLVRTARGSGSYKDGWVLRGGECIRKRAGGLRMELLWKRMEKKGGNREVCWNHGEYFKKHRLSHIPQTPPHITSVLCDLILWISREEHFGPDGTLDLILFGIVLSSQMGFEMAHTLNCMIKEANTFQWARSQKQGQQNQKSAYPGLRTEMNFDYSENSVILLCCKLPMSLSFALNGPITSLFPRLDAM